MEKQALLQELHETLLQFLLDYKETHPGFKFLTRTDKETERLENRQWFNGTDKYIAIFFTNREAGDLSNKQLGFFVNLGENGIEACRMEIKLKGETDDKVRECYNEIIPKLKAYGLKEEGRQKYKLYYSNDPLEALKTFLERDYKLIMDEAAKWGLSEAFSISDDQFMRRYKHVENYRSGNVTKATGKEKTSPTNTSLALNTILYGPPGTGKTYNAIEEAVKIVDGKGLGSHQLNKQRFDELRKQKQIEFITFHQNYTYEDFMVGLKPVTNGNQLAFESHQGVFYRMVFEARRNYEASLSEKSKDVSFEDRFEAFIEPLVEEKIDNIPVEMSSGKLFFVDELDGNTIRFRKSKGQSNHTLSVSTLKQLYYGNRAMISGLSSYYKALITQLQKMSVEQVQSNGLRKKYVLVIDEINRANISRVFGELITLLEDDKRLGADNELRVTLPNGEPDFGIPPNLHIIGTMNTADKSIALIDVALRRRFEFIGYYPKEDLLKEGQLLLKTINRKIFELKKSADFLIGHAYLLGKTSDQAIQEVIQKKIIPLLMEYFSNNTETVKGLFIGSGWSASYDSDNYSWQVSKASKTLADEL